MALEHTPESLKRLCKRCGKSFGRHCSMGDFCPTDNGHNFNYDSVFTENIVCHDCSLEYNSPGWIETTIPDKIWNKIRPAFTAEGCGILCISCIAKRLKVLGYHDVPIWLCGMEPFKTFCIAPEECLEIIRNWDQDV